MNTLPLSITLQLQFGSYTSSTTITSFSLQVRPLLMPFMIMALDNSMTSARINADTNALYIVQSDSPIRSVDDVAKVVGGLRDAIFALGKITGIFEVMWLKEG